MKKIGMFVENSDVDELSSLNSKRKLQVNKDFEQSVIKRELENEVVCKTLKLLSNV